MSRCSSTLAAVLVLMLAGCDRAAPGTPQGEAAADTSASLSTIDRGNAGDFIPAVELASVAGERLDLAALEGRPVLLNLWATWCAPCVREMPLLDDLAQDYEGDLRVVTASQDLGNPGRVRAFFAERDFAMLEPWLDPRNALMTALGVDLLPVTVLYDAQGQEVWRVRGDYDWASEEARAAIEEGFAPPF